MNEISPQERKQIAARFKMSEQYLYQCLTGRRDMDHATAMRLELATGGTLTRKMLCHKSYAAVWPELASSGKKKSRAR